MDRLRGVNEALLKSSVREHDLKERSQEAETAIRKAHAYIAAILHTTPVPLLVLASDTRVITANEAFYRRFEVEPHETEGRLIYELDNGQWNIPRLRDLLEEILPEHTWFEGFEVTHDFEHNGARTMLLNARRVELTPGGPAQTVLVIDDITERRQAEEAVRQGERELADFFETAALGLHWVGPDGIIQRVNQAELDMLGYDYPGGREEYVGRHIAEFHADQPVIEDILDRLARGEILRDYPARLRRRDGAIRNVMINSSVLFENGEYKHTRCFTHDITDRLQAERALAESEAKYRLLFEAIDVGFCVIEVLFDDGGKPIDYRFIEVNPAFEAQTGIRDAEGKRMRDIAPAHEEHWFEIYGRIALTGEPARFEHRAEQFGRWFDVHAYRTGKPQERRVAVLFNDITARVKIEQALRESEALFHSLADNIDQLSWICEGTLGNATWYNQRWLDYTGLTFEDMKDWGWKNVHHPEHVDRVIESVNAANDSGEEWEDTFPIRGADGEYRWFLSRAIPIRDDAGTIVKWFGTNTDITEQREMERRINAQAAQIAGESKRKDEFLAMLSHELRNPLAPIRSAVHLMKTRTSADAAGGAGGGADGDGSEDAISTQAREIIERQVNNLTRLVSDLLDVSRAVSGRMRLDEEILDLNRVVQRAIETAMPLVVEHRHELLSNLCPDPVWVKGDATRLEEVFINLLTNAAKYTPDGGRIEVWCEHVSPGASGTPGHRVRGEGESRTRDGDDHDDREDPHPSPLPKGAKGEGVKQPHPPSEWGEGDHVQVRVRDNGMGIDEELLPRIFDLFSQADRSLARGAGGLGIGLSLAQRLVHLHGGRIEAFSPPLPPRGEGGGEGEGEEHGAGTEFIVTLGAVAPDISQRRAEPEAPAGISAEEAAEMRVLVVDDNVDLVLMLTTTLRQSGYRVQSAYTGPDGLNVARQWRPDVLLLDIDLPGLDGYEVARRLRGDRETFGDEGFQGRLIALTGYGRDADIDLARETGFDAQLVKPYEFEELEKLMHLPRRSR